MFRKVCVSTAVVCFTGVAFAEIPQIVTAEVFDNYGQEVTEYVQESYVEPVVRMEQPVEPDIPVWPIPGSEADVEITCAGGFGCGNEESIVTRSGSDLIIENNINTIGTGWSGGPNITNNVMIPEGFDYECANNAEMPLLRREMMEDDGGTVLAISRSSRKMCGGGSNDPYAMFAQRAGFAAEKTCNATTTDNDKEIAVNEYVEEENSSVASAQDEVRSWVVADGQTLREVLQSWCDKAGWDLVWTTAREYPIEASAVFKGRFMDVASALVRNFERATPIPYAKFYKGNRVVVVSTSEE
jgi:hypothetical protein